MFRIMYKSKIHEARVTETQLQYEGSITIDEKLMEAANIIPGERLEIFNLSNGARFSTYAIKGEKGSGVICLNGAAARLTEVGDKVIIISYAVVTEEEARTLKPKMVLVNEKNIPVKG
ncbi:MAG: aspartate 1-decarboxylase [bacterium]